MNKTKDKILQDFEVDYEILMDLIKEAGYSGFVIDSLKRKVSKALDTMREETLREVEKLTKDLLPVQSIDKRSEKHNNSLLKLLNLKTKNE